MEFIFLIKHVFCTLSIEDFGSVVCLKTMIECAVEDATFICLVD